AGVSTRRRLSTGRHVGRFHDVEAAAVEKERMVPEQPRQLRQGRTVCRNRFSIELTQGSLDLCGCQLHRTLLLVFWTGFRGASHRRGGQVVDPVFPSIHLGGPATRSSEQGPRGAIFGLRGAETNNATCLSTSPARRSPRT